MAKKILPKVKLPRIKLPKLRPKGGKEVLDVIKDLTTIRHKKKR